MPRVAWGDLPFLTPCHGLALGIKRCSSSELPVLLLQLLQEHRGRGRAECTALQIVIPYDNFRVAFGALHRTGRALRQLRSGSVLALRL